MSFPHDFVYAIHWRQRRASQNRTEDYSAGRNAETAAAKEQDGFDNSKQNELLYQYSQHHSGRS